MRSDAIRPGDVIGGKYRVRAILSRTRGFLVEAFHTEFDQRVVVRVLSPALCDEKEVERFRREARILAKLESEYVARILDVGTLPDGAFYFARPYLEGIDLAAHLKKRGALPLGEAVQLILQASEAVSETHVHNIILRELQPSHLFLTQRLGGQPVLKVIDFGTAKLLRDAAAPGVGGEMTATSMFGLSCYSSPELIRKAKHVDVRTDVWSLGAILYQMLAGRPPFDGEMAALMLQISRDEPTPLTRYRRDLPGEIDPIIGWALAKDPDGRFANVHGFAHALTPFASAEGQVLIHRIGEITTAAKQRKKAGAAAVDRDHPISIDNNDLLEDDDDGAATRVHSEHIAAMPIPQQRPAAGRVQPPVQLQPAQGTHPGSGGGGESPLERTVFIGPDFKPPSPAASPAGPPPPQARPQTGPMPMFGGAAAGMAMPPPQAGPSQPPTSLLGPPLEMDAQRPSWGNAPASSPGMNGIQAQPQQGAPPSIPRAAMQTVLGGANAAKPPPAGARVALIAVGGAVVVLSAIAALVLIKGRPGGDAPAGSEAALTSAAPSAGTAAVTTASATATVAAADPPPPATVDAPPPSPSGAPSVKVAVADPPSTGKAPAGSPSSKPTGKATATAAVTTPPPPPPPPAGGDSGTLVAVAVGGSCAFSVNGASKGTASTLKLQVKPGSYSVTCKPSTGATKSKSVTVQAGGSAMAMFKL